MKLLRKHLKNWQDWGAGLTQQSLEEREQASSFYRLCEHITPGEVMVFAGRPSMGTNIVAEFVVAEFALERNIPVAYFKPSVSAEATIERLIMQRADIDRGSMHQQRLTPQRLKRYKKAVSDLKASPILLDDARHSVESLCKAFKKSARRLATLTTGQGKNIGLVVIDSVDDLKASPANEVGNNTEMTHLILQLKALAMDFSVAVVLVCGVNRAVEKRRLKKPQVTDVKDWCDLKPGVDKVALFYREAIYFPKKHFGHSFIQIDVSHADQTLIERCYLFFNARSLRNESI
jgi:replicative DNA helicase